MIDQATIQKIFDASDIVDVISDFVSLKKAGQNYKGYSPFTNEKTPSFFVSPAKGIFKCFSTGKGGNAVSFLMEHEKLSYPEALKTLAKKYNIDIVEKELSAEEIKQQNERESLLTITSFAQKYFTNTLLNTNEGNAIGLSYFKERGFKRTTIDKFQLGYSPEQRDAFTQHAQKSGYKTDYLLKTGLTIQKETRQFDRFHGRVIFPIHSISGQVLGFGGRIMKADDKMAKYLNSPESEIYHKSNVLYGLYFAKNTIIKQDQCFMVEGYTDVLSMHQNGIENVVASSGTSLTTGQIRLIKRFTKNITIIYDGDAAGIKASLRGIDLVLEEGLNVKVLLLPDGEDPDSFAQKRSSSQFISFIENNARDFITFKTNLLAKEAEHDPVKKVQLITDVVNSIAVIPDGITRSVYISECAKTLQIKEEVLHSEVFNKRQTKSGKKAQQEYYKKEQQKKSPLKAVTKVEAPQRNIYEKEIIQYILNYGNNALFTVVENGNEVDMTVAQFLVHEIEKDEIAISDELYAQFYAEIKNMLVENGTIDVKYFTMHNNPEITSEAVNCVTQSYTLSKIWDNDHNIDPELRLKETVPLSVVSLKASKIDELIKENQQEIQHKQNDIEKLNEVLYRQTVLNSLRKELYSKRGSIM